MDVIVHYWQSTKHFVVSVNWKYSASTIIIIIVNKETTLIVWAASNHNDKQHAQKHMTQIFRKISTDMAVYAV